MLMCLSAAVLALAACGESTPTPTPTPAPGDDPVTPVNPTDDLSKKVTVTMDVGYEKNTQGMKFTKAALDTASLTKYTGLDGNEYEAGDFKPAWSYMQKQLNFTITDANDYQSNVKTRFENLKTNGYKFGNVLVNIAQGNADQIQSAGVVDGTILNLAQYLDMMPNFKKFLENNPSVRKIVNASDGGIYYAPYFDGYDDIEKMLLLRKDWVEKLLDTGDLSSFDSKAVDMKKYTPVTPESVDSAIDVLDNADGTKATKKITITKKHTQNVITKQNALASQTGAELVKALREYIDATYGKAYSKRSELFIGGKAAYDIDELVALFRCVKANPGALTGDANKVIVPFLPREITDQRISDFWRFLQFFGVRGGESRNGWFYVKDDGTLGDMRAEEGTMKALDAMHKMYEEGLILQNFNKTTATAKGKGAADLLDDPSANQQGFAMYDYVQTQTIRDDTVNGLQLIPVLPGVWDWKETGKYMHYTESWRSVKPNGWFITRATAGDQDVLYRCLKIFDYQYSEEGNRLMSYGPDAYIAKKADGTLDTIAYMGKQVPKLSEGTLAQLKALTKGNYTNYYRYFVGGTFPIGYIKEQGMEYQTTSAVAQPHLMGIENAINLGVLEHPNHNTNNTKGMYDIVPAALAYKTTEQNLVNSMTAMSAVFAVQKKQENVFNTVVIEGWDSANLTSFKASSGTYDLGRANYLKTVKETLQVESFLKLSNDAYARMGMNSRKK